MADQQTPSSTPGPTSGQQSLVEILLSWIEPYRRPEMAAMLLLGFASGLPLYLVYQKTSYWLRLEGIDRSTIGFFYWVGMAYSFKFIWAPIIDKLKIPILEASLGHRRSWMLVSIFGTVLGLLTIATANPSESLWPVTIGALILAFSGATLDVSIDAWRIESAPTRRQANMAASYSLGYRGALIFSGLGLIVADFTSWNLSFAFMAASMAACGALILLIKEPVLRHPRKVIDDLPLFAGPPNAIVIGTALFVGARICTWFNAGDLTINILAALAVGVILVGPVVLKATKTHLPHRLQFAALGLVFIYIRPLWQYFFSFNDASKWLSLAVLLSSFTLVAAFAFTFRQAYVALQTKSPAPESDAARGKVYELFATPFQQVYVRFGMTLIPILLLVMIYRLSDFTMGVMASPLYADLGYKPAVVGGIQSGPGVLAIIIGLFIGGIAAHKFGIMRAMILGAGLTLITNGAYAWFAATAAESPDAWRLIVAICADNVAGGFVTTVFIAYLSSLVDPAYAATQYALFSSLYALLNKFAAGFSGLMADAVGYVTFFLITASYAIPAALLVIWVMQLQAKQQTEP